MRNKTILATVLLAVIALLGSWAITVWVVYLAAHLLDFEVTLKIATGVWFIIFATISFWEVELK